LRPVPRRVRERAQYSH
jgi:hypothetical protein